MTPFTYTFVRRGRPGRRRRTGHFPRVRARPRTPVRSGPWPGGSDAVDLPYSTSLDVVIAFGPVGTLDRSRGRVKLRTTIPFQVRADPFVIMFNGTTITTTRFRNQEAPLHLASAVMP